MATKKMTQQQFNEYILGEASKLYKLAVLKEEQNIVKNPADPVIKREIGDKVKVKNDPTGKTYPIEDIKRYYGRVSGRYYVDTDGVQKPENLYELDGYPTALYDSDLIFL